jgi:hypothetical protein
MDKTLAAKIVRFLLESLLSISFSKTDQATAAYPLSTGAIAIPMLKGLPLWGRIFLNVVRKRHYIF